MDNVQLLDFDLFGGRKEMPRGNKKRFNDNYTRRGALSHARRRLERAYGVKGENNFNADELDELRQIFEFYDIDSSKTMDLSELNMALRALGYNTSEKEVHDLASLMDVDGDMTMDFSEFCMIVEYMKAEKGLEAELRDAFRCIDTNGDGYVTAEELLELLMTKGNTMSLKEASELIRFVDKNGDGRLDYEEFMRVILEHRNLSRSSTFYSVASISMNSLQSKDAPKPSSEKYMNKQQSYESTSLDKRVPTSAAVEESSEQATTSNAVASTSTIYVNGETPELNNSAPITATEKEKTMNAVDHNPLPLEQNDRKKSNNTRSSVQESVAKASMVSINVVGPESGEVLGSVVLETRT